MMDETVKDTVNKYTRKYVKKILNNPEIELRESISIGISIYGSIALTAITDIVRNEKHADVLINDLTKFHITLMKNLEEAKKSRTFEEDDDEEKDFLNNLKNLVTDSELSSLEDDFKEFVERPGVKEAALEIKNILDKMARANNK